MKDSLVYINLKTGNLILRKYYIELASVRMGGDYECLGLLKSKKTIENNRIVIRWQK